LKHYDRDTFSFDFVGLGDEGEHDVGAAFSSTNGREADAVTIDLLNATGQGIFRRETDGG
jgi:hypothetical protein